MSFYFQGETYSFKDAIVLGEYKVDDSTVPNEKKGEKVKLSSNILVKFVVRNICRILL